MGASVTDRCCNLEAWAAGAKKNPEATAGADRLTPYLSLRLTVPPMAAEKTTSKTGSAGGAL
jgi:hypothetical protein